MVVWGGVGGREDDVNSFVMVRGKAELVVYISLHNRRGWICGVGCVSGVCITVDWGAEKIPVLGLLNGRITTNRQCRD